MAIEHLEGAERAEHRVEQPRPTRGHSRVVPGARAPLVHRQWTTARVTGSAL